MVLRCFLVQRTSNIIACIKYLIHLLLVVIISLFSCIDFLQLLNICIFKRKIQAFFHLVFNNLCISLIESMNFQYLFNFFLIKVFSLCFHSRKIHFFVNYSFLYFDCIFILNDLLNLICCFNNLSLPFGFQILINLKQHIHSIHCLCLS
jgi:hypothetical protein